MGAPQHSDCIGCHMPPTGQSSTRATNEATSSRTIPPKVTIELGEGDPASSRTPATIATPTKKQKPEDLQKALDGEERHCQS